jgi:hypothetical protein
MQVVEVKTPLFFRGLLERAESSENFSEDEGEFIEA